MEKLIIDRSKWRTGGSSEIKTGQGHTELLNEEGYMCCLGFFCISRKIEKNSIISITEPEMLLHTNDGKKIPELVNIMNDEEDYLVPTFFCARAMEINDSHIILIEEKEEMIKELFKEKNIEVEFIGEYALKDL